MPNATRYCLTMNVVILLSLNHGFPELCKYLISCLILSQLNLQCLKNVDDLIILLYYIIYIILTPCVDEINDERRILYITCEISMALN
jgi:hypothetical protein